jgi:hypothetical protein
LSICNRLVLHLKTTPIAKILWGDIHIAFGRGIGNLSAFQTCKALYYGDLHQADIEFYKTQKGEAPYEKNCFYLACDGVGIGSLRQSCADGTACGCPA